MTEDNTASSWAIEAGKALIPGGLSGSIFGIVGGFGGAELFESNSTYSCSGAQNYLHSEPMPLLQGASSCTKTLDIPFVGQVYSAEQAGTIVGFVIALVVGIIATGFVLTSNRPGM